MAYHHGIQIQEVSGGTRPLTDISTASIGLVAIADDADPDVFPLDVPVLLLDAAAAAGKAGDNGNLGAVLHAISSQVIAPVTVVRVSDGNDDESIRANIIGKVEAEGWRSGMQALLTAESLNGVKPRILGVPTFDDKEVASALAIVAQKLRGFAYAKSIGDTVAEATEYRDEFSARELMLIDGDATGLEGSAIACALGLRAKLDQQIGWHKTISNAAINGVTGITHPRSFSTLANDVTDVSALNDKDITALVRHNGYRFWGNRTCSDEPLFAFESVVRTGQVLQDMIAEGLVWAIDKPITAGLVRDIVESINAKFRSLKAQGRIIGAQCWFDPASNPAEALAAGKIEIDWDYTACAPAENIKGNQRITNKYYADLANSL